MDEMAVVPPAASASDIAGLDSEAFADWVRPHWDVLTRLAQKLAETGEWEDVLQDALAAAWRKRRQFDPQRGTPRNWLLAIVADQARKSHRRVLRAKHQQIDQPYDDKHVDLDLERALSVLTVKQRTAIVLHYYLGLPIADVAAIMSWAPGTAKSTLSDARTRLRRALGEDFR